MRGQLLVLQRSLEDCLTDSSLCCQCHRQIEGSHGQCHAKHHFLHNFSLPLNFWSIWLVQRNRCIRLNRKAPDDSLDQTNFWRSRYAPFQTTDLMGFWWILAARVVGTIIHSNRFE